jgi:hypothetical protein
MTQETNLNAPWSLHFDRDGTENTGYITDAEGNVIASSHLPGWLPETQDDYLAMPTLFYQLKLMAAAPKLLNACKQALAAMEASLENDDPLAPNQIEWEAEPLSTLRAAITEADASDE